jgi:chorismate mutase
VQGGQYADLSDTLSLGNIRQSLILMEDTIIFALIERAQFARNGAVYEAGSIPVPGYTRDGRQLCLLEYLLRETEQVHGRIRRYTNPDETAFFPDDLPPLVLPPLAYPQVLAPCGARINLNASIMAMYLDHLLPDIAPGGDDSNYGSAALYDVMILQALSRRIHYGKFVAEAKFRAAPEEYSALIRARDAGAIMELLTDRAVEAKVVARVALKAATFGQDLSAAAAAEAAAAAAAAAGGGGAPGQKIRPEAVARLYEQWVMPLTKEVEVEYLLQRLDD